MILGRFGTERQRLSQRDRIRRTGCGTEHRRYYSKAHLKVSELDDAERKGDLTVDHDGHVVLKSARQRSSRYGIFICLELRKDSECVCAYVDFPFPLSSILDLLTNCFNAFSSCEMKILEECTIPSSSHGLLAVEPFTYVRFSPPSSRTFVDIHFFSKLNILPSRLTRV